MRCSSVDKGTRLNGQCASVARGVTGIGNDIQKTFHFDGAGLYAAVGDEMHADALTPLRAILTAATYDDGSCQYDDAWAMRWHL